MDDMRDVVAYAVGLRPTNLQALYRAWLQSGDPKHRFDEERKRRAMQEYADALERDALHTAAGGDSERLACYPAAHEAFLAAKAALDAGATVEAAADVLKSRLTPEARARAAQAQAAKDARQHANRADVEAADAARLVQRREAELADAIAVGENVEARTADLQAARAAEAEARRVALDAARTADEARRAAQKAREAEKALTEEGDHD